jgi:arylsulfatase A-like enzyme
MRKISSTWMLLWAFLGFALPILFLQQADTVLLYLRPFELLPLYGTEWILIALLGVAVTITLAWISSAVQAVPLLKNVLLERRVLIAFVTAVTGAGAAAWYNFQPRFSALQISVVAVAAAIFTPSRALTGPWLTKLVAAFRLVGIGGAVAAAAALIVRPVSAERTGRAAAMVDAPSRDLPNVVLVTLDALSARHLSLYGATRATSPQLDGFAQSALVFDHAYANGNFTTEGVSSIMTGTRPWTHRALQAASKPSAATAAASLPALLHAAGYVTVSVSTNPWAGPRRLGLARDFVTEIPDSYPAVSICSEKLTWLLPYTCVAMQSGWLSAVWARLNTWYLKLLFANNRAYDPDVPVSATLRWLRTHPASPLFLWLHLIQPHDPYAPPRPWLQKFDGSDVALHTVDSATTYAYDWSTVSPSRRSALEARYDESIAYVDAAVGRLLRGIGSTLGANTLTIVTSDHGESFRANYGGHGGPELSDELIHIPLIIRMPVGSDLSGRRDELVEQIDIAPTIVDVVGIAKPPSWEGRSLLKVDRQAPDTHIAYAMNFERNGSRDQLAIGSIATLQGDWKLVEYLGHPRYSNIPELTDALFRIRTDPREEHDVAALHPEVVRSLQTLRIEEFTLHAGKLDAQ